MNGKEEIFQDFCQDFVQEFGLWTVEIAQWRIGFVSHSVLMNEELNQREREMWLPGIGCLPLGEPTVNVAS